MDQMREAFEAWYEGHCAPLEADWFKRDSDFPDDYDCFPAQEAWAGWQASRDAQCVNLPDSERSIDCGDVLYRSDVEDALIAAGIRYT